MGNDLAGLCSPDPLPVGFGGAASADHHSIIPARDGAPWMRIVVRLIWPVVGPNEFEYVFAKSDTHARICPLKCKD